MDGEAVRRVGRYRLVGELGRDAAGVIYDARTEGDERRFALRLIVGSGRRRLRFLRETQALFGLDHPHLQRLIDAGEEADRLYLVTEHPDGRSVAEALAADGAFGAVEAAELVRQAAEGVAHAHTASIVHRDLRPERVVIDRDGWAQVCDFALADEAGSPSGDAAFQAPEQRRGDVAAVGPRTDVYGLGALLRACRGGAAAAPDRRLDAIQARCLATDPTDRYPSADALAEALEAYGDEGAPTPRSVIIVGALAGLLALAVAVTALIALAQHRGDADVAALTTSAFTGKLVSKPHKERDDWLRTALGKVQAAEWKAAEEALDEALAIDARHGPSYTQRGRVRKELGRLDEAKADFEYAIELMPADPRPWFQLGLLHVVGNDIKAAEQAFDQAVKRRPGRPEFRSRAYNNRGKCRLARKSFGPALQDFSAAIKANPKNARAYFNAGLARIGLKDYPAAAEALTKAIEIDPRYIKAIYNRGETNRRLERYTEAIADYTRCLELAPDAHWVRPRRAQAYALNRQFRKALVDIEIALKHEPKEAWIYLHYAVILKALGRFDDAIAAVRKGLTLYPNARLKRALQLMLKRTLKQKGMQPPSR